MAVETRYSDVFPNPSDKGRKIIDSARLKGLVHVIIAQSTIEVGDLATSVIHLANVPSRAIIHPDSQLYNEGVTGLTDVDLGGSNDVDALIDGASFAAAADKKALTVPGRASYGKRLWELLGYATDPGGELGLFLTLNVDAGGAASKAVTLMLRYSI